MRFDIGTLNYEKNVLRAIYKISNNRDKKIFLGSLFFFFNP